MTRTINKVDLNESAEEDFAQGTGEYIERFQS